MQISIPTRLNPRYVAIFIALVFVGQELESTNPIFAVLTAVYIALWATTYNLTGGIEYPSGAFVLSNGLFSVVIGFAAKVLLLQPGERNMRAPLETLFCYTVGMIMMLIVVFITRSLRPARGMLKGFDTLPQLKRAAIACLLVGAGLSILVSRSRVEGGTILSALAQLNAFPIMAILLGTTYEVKASNGKRSVNWVVACGISINILYGLIFFGKEGIFIGFFAWALAASLQGYNFRRNQLIGLAIGLVFVVYYLVPYSQYVRNFGSKAGSAVENIPIALSYLSNLNETRRLYYENIEDFDISDEPHLYDQREGFLDRLVLVAPDDALIDYTDKGHIFGLEPTYVEYTNLIPHFLWPDKPLFNTGNVYAHELGELADEDQTTGISFSATADAYHQAAWLGILVILPLNTFILFIVMDTVAGSAKHSPFALLPVTSLFEGGAAGGVGAMIHVATYGVLGLLLIVWTTKVATPFVLNFVSPGRRADRHGEAMRDPAQGLAAIAPPSQSIR